MNKEILYCNNCGETISEQEFRDFNGLCRECDHSLSDIYEEDEELEDE